MALPRNDGIRLFRVAGIEVSLHWLWFLVAYYQISTRQRDYSSIVWNIGEYLILFLIVLLHEFGHALACRQVGGRADKIMLWPLGGVAFVDPPRRPGAHLWSIAAGPLVNVALAIPLLLLARLDHQMHWKAVSPDLHLLVRDVFVINLALLIFNLLPIYPLDGGQILRSILWFFMGESSSLRVASAIGFVGVAGLGFYAFKSQSIWMGVLTFWMFQRCLQGWKRAQAITTISRLPRRTGFSCPACHEPPPIGAVWGCSACKTKVDPFETNGTCPNCGKQFPTTQCIECRTAHPFEQWNETPASVTTEPPASVPPPLPERA